MKTKIVLAVICLLFTCSTFAGISRSTTDNWLKKADGSSLRATKPVTDDIGEPGDDPSVTPIGEGVWLMLGLGLVYGICSFRQRKAA